MSRLFALCRAEFYLADQVIDHNINLPEALAYRGLDFQQG